MYEIPGLIHRITKTKLKIKPKTFLHEVSVVSKGFVQPISLLEFWKYVTGNMKMAALRTLICILENVQKVI